MTVDMDRIGDLLESRRCDGQTHWGDCHYSHVDCAVHVLARELQAARTGHRAAVRALSVALGERDRLADGIREGGHQDWCGFVLTQTPEHCNCPMALLDVAVDTEGGT